MKHKTFMESFKAVLKSVFRAVFDSLVNMENTSNTHEPRAGQ